jgi:DNA ligase-1
MIDESMMMHGGDWAGEDLAGWWISEKLHGCRAYWDGAGAMWTRNGNQVRIPAAWRAWLPAIELDGELWAGIGQFAAARLATQYGRFTPAVRFMVFDANLPGDFLDRQAALHSALVASPCAFKVAHARTPSTAAALDRLRAVRAHGGEGIIARHPGNVYAAGRTREILKLKDPSNVYALVQGVK